MNSLPDDCQRLIWKFVFDFCIEEMNNDYNLKLRRRWADSSSKYRKLWHNNYISFASAKQYSDECVLWALKRINGACFMNMNKPKLKRIIHYYDNDT
jgi:hypothetical protein